MTPAQTGHKRPDHPTREGLAATGVCAMDIPHGLWFEISFATLDPTLCFAPFVDAHQLTVRVPKHKDTGADVSRGPGRRQPADSTGAVGSALSSRKRADERRSSWMRQRRRLPSPLSSFIGRLS